MKLKDLFEKVNQLNEKYPPDTEIWVQQVDYCVDQGQIIYSQVENIKYQDNSLGDSIIITLKF